MFSIMIHKRHILLLAVLILIGSPFLKAGGDETAIKVNGRKITVSEFISRLNSLPRSTKGSPEEIKENLISTLIAESVLAYEASSVKLDTSEQYRLMTEEFKKEALYEKWMDEEIRNKVRYSEKELQDMYAKMREIRTVEYWTFKTENEASEFKRIAEKDTSILIQPQTKDLICGEALEDVENAVYKLKKGGLTSPLFVENSYYVFRLKSVAPHPEYSKRNYVYWISEAETYVKDRKEKDLLNSALLVLMKGKEFTIDTKAYDYIHSKLYPIVYGSNNQLRFSSPEMIQLDLINEENNNDINIDNRTVVRFKNGEEWKVKDLWKKISVSPYPLNFKNPADLKPGLLDIIRRIIIVESIAGNAEQLGLGDSPYVRSETEMWSKNLSASYFIKNYSSSLAITDEEIAALYDTVKYNFIKPEIRKIEYIEVPSKELANSIYMQTSGGANFEDMYRKYVKNGYQTEDEIATFITQEMLGEIGKAAFALTPGAVSQPVKSSDTSYAVVKLLETRSAAPYPLDEIREPLKIKKRLYETIKYLNEYLSKVVKNYDISINRELIDKALFLEGNMSVKKTHFPLRNSVPSSFAFTRQAEWYKDLLVRINASRQKN